MREAWEKAFATDRQAPFGGVLAVNTTFDGACAEAVAGIFSEVIRVAEPWPIEIPIAKLHPRRL